jgi:four helix bundle protein
MMDVGDAVPTDPAATSIAANIPEGWTRESKREKAQFPAIAHGSLAETEALRGALVG